jgi:hypothetical protein
MFDTFTFETSTRKLSPSWQAAYRFARERQPAVAPVHSAKRNGLQPSA